MSSAAEVSMLERSSVASAGRSRKAQANDSVFEVSRYSKFSKELRRSKFLTFWLNLLPNQPLMDRGWMVLKL